MRRLWQILAQNNNNNVAYITMRTFKKRIPPAENREQSKHKTFCYNFGHYNNDDNNTQN